MAIRLAAVAAVVLLASCGSDQVHGTTGSTRSTAGGAPATAPATASTPGGKPSSRGRAPSDAPSTRPVSPRYVVADVRRATATCVDLPQSRDVRLPSRLARLPAPLPAAQAALIVARRTYASLSHARIRGTLGRDAVTVARARVSGIEAVNYAIERHDRVALAISSRAVAEMSARLNTLGRRAHLRGCR